MEKGCVICGQKKCSQGTLENRILLQNVLGSVEIPSDITECSFCPPCTRKVREIEKLIKIQQKLVEDFKKTNRKNAKETGKKLNDRKQIVTRSSKRKAAERPLSNEKTVQNILTNKKVTSHKDNPQYKEEDECIEQLPENKVCTADDLELKSEQNKCVSNEKNMIDRNFHMNNQGDIAYGDRNIHRDIGNLLGIGIQKSKCALGPKENGEINLVGPSAPHENAVSLDLSQQNEESAQSEEQNGNLDKSTIEIDRVKKKHKCLFCEKLFSSFNSRRKHYITEHDKDFKKKCSHKCLHCDKSYHHAPSLDSHILKEHKEKHENYQCEDCKEYFTLFVPFRKHCRQHTCSDEKYTCNICGKTFKKNHNLQYHLESHRTERKTRCDKCGKLFKGRISLASHIYCTHSETYNQTHRTGILLCHYCGKSFKTRRCLLAHLRCHTGHNTHKCNICNAVFPNRSRLKRHIATVHTKVPAFECIICQKKFVHEVSYQGHLKMHNDIRPYLCSTCGKGFRTNNHLKEHMNIHTGLKPFLCTICNESFLWRAQLLKHRKRHHLKEDEKLSTKKNSQNKKIKYVTEKETIITQESNSSLTLTASEGNEKLSSSIIKQVEAQTSLGKNQEVEQYISLPVMDTRENQSILVSSAGENLQFVPIINSTSVDNSNYAGTTANIDTVAISQDQISVTNHVLNSVQTCKSPQRVNQVTLPFLGNVTDIQLKQNLTPDIITQADHIDQDQTKSLTFFTFTNAMQLPTQKSNLEPSDINQGGDVSNCSYVLLNLSSSTPRENMSTVEDNTSQSSTLFTNS